MSFDDDGNEYIERRKEQHINEEVAKALDKFSEAYGLQKGIDLDDVELCVYEESNGKRAVMYFRRKRLEIKRYGNEPLQS